MQHTVHLRVPGAKDADLDEFRVVSVEAPTAGAAANLAEVQVKHEEGREPELQSVATHRFVLGRCQKCGTVIFIGDSVRQRHGRLRCSECP